MDGGTSTDCIKPALNGRSPGEAENSVEEVLFGVDDFLVMIFSQEEDRLVYRGGGVIAHQGTIVAAANAREYASGLFVLHNRLLHKVGRVRCCSDSGCCLLSVPNLRMPSRPGVSISAGQPGCPVYAVGLSPMQQLQYFEGRVIGYLLMSQFRYVLTSLSLPKDTLFGLFDLCGRLVGVCGSHVRHSGWEAGFFPLDMIAELAACGPRGHHRAGMGLPIFHDL